MLVLDALLKAASYALRHCRMMKMRGRSCPLASALGGKIFEATGNSGAQSFRRMNSGNTIAIQPARNVSGALRLPGDKSISHRYAMLAALAEGVSRFENFSTGADCATADGYQTQTSNSRFVPGTGASVSSFASSVQS